MSSEVNQWIGFCVSGTYEPAPGKSGTLPMSEDYIRTARAKGLPERRVILRHGIRSAIPPIVTAAGLDIGVLLGGVILVESVFNIPGIGRLAYNSIQNDDLPMIQGTVLMGAFFIVTLNLLVDIGYAFIDPRVRYS